VVETPTHFVCVRKAAEDAASAELKRKKQEWKKQGKKLKEIRELAAAEASDEPPSCGFILPRTVCKREITRDEALVYLKTGKTELLEDFTSRFGRPFSATLVLKENGRHGFEFPPRKARGGASADEESATPRRAAARTSGKKKAGKTTKKRTTRKKTGTKKSTARKSTAKKSSAAKTGARAGRGKQATGARAGSKGRSKGGSRKKTSSKKSATP
jgi:hypothetical protein